MRHGKSNISHCFDLLPFTAPNALLQPSELQALLFCLCIALLSMSHLHPDSLEQIKNHFSQSLQLLKDFIRYFHITTMMTLLFLFFWIFIKNWIIEIIFFRTHIPGFISCYETESVWSWMRLQLDHLSTHRGNRTFSFTTPTKPDKHVDPEEPTRCVWLWDCPRGRPFHPVILRIQWSRWLKPVWYPSCRWCSRCFRNTSNGSVWKRRWRRTTPRWQNEWKGTESTWIYWGATSTVLLWAKLWVSDMQEHSCSFPRRTVAMRCEAWCLRSLPLRATRTKWANIGVRGKRMQGWRSLPLSTPKLCTQ